VKLFSKNSILCDHNPPKLQTDGQTDRRRDRQTTCDGNTALSTKVHRAVKTVQDCKFATVANAMPYSRVAAGVPRRGYCYLFIEEKTTIFSIFFTTLLTISMTII